MATELNEHTIERLASSNANEIGLFVHDILHGHYHSTQGRLDGLPVTTLMGITDDHPDIRSQVMTAAIGFLEDLVENPDSELDSEAGHYLHLYINGRFLPEGDELIKTINLTLQLLYRTDPIVGTDKPQGNFHTRAYQTLVGLKYKGDIAFWTQDLDKHPLYYSYAIYGIGNMGWDTLFEWLSNLSEQNSAIEAGLKNYVWDQCVGLGPDVAQEFYHNYKTWKDKLPLYIQNIIDIE